MTTFKTRLSQAARSNGRVILANDYDLPVQDLYQKTLQNIRDLHQHVCGIKLNFHLLVPLGGREIASINKAAHEHGLQTIADIKLNDIRNTNRITAGRLWDLGFDAVIANPIMGPESLLDLTEMAHEAGRGVISLCHMSAPEARISYELRIGSQEQHLYRLFLEWALASGVDGIIVGATFPDIIRYCSGQAAGRLDILSPGVGTQGGDAGRTVSSGADYLIVGRTILGAQDPVRTASELSLGTLGK